MIAWFPDEHVIRMIGPECFKTLNPEGHWDAVETFDREEAEKRTISYLLKNLHLAGDAIKVIERTYPTLQAIDEVRATLQNRIKEVMRIDLWRHTSRGVLEVHVPGRRVRRNRDGSEEVVEFLDIQKWGEFQEYKMFSPRVSRLASRMTSVATRLGFIDFEDIGARVREMNLEDKAKAARMLSKNLEAASGIIEEAENLRRGFRPDRVAILKGWFRHQGAPIHLAVDCDDTNFYIGMDEAQKLRIEIPRDFWNVIQPLPKIPTVSQWDADQEHQG
jgi:hypothetical protein